MKPINLMSLMTVIKNHKLMPVNGEYKLTEEMIAEATAIDEKQGTSIPPNKVAELRVMAERDDDEVDDFAKKVEQLLVRERPGYGTAVSALTKVAMSIAENGMDMDHDAARSYLAAVIKSLDWSEIDIGH